MTAQLLIQLFISQPFGGDQGEGVWGWVELWREWDGLGD
jgi:hypothetical protein